MVYSAYSLSFGFGIAKRLRNLIRKHGVRKEGDEEDEHKSYDEW